MPSAIACRYHARFIRSRSESLLTNPHSTNTAGFQGGFISQEFVTAQKNKLARSVATQDVQAAQWALRRTRIELASLVRNGYFDVLLAQQRVKYTRALAQLALTLALDPIPLAAG